jgi:hypothetical protein
VRPLEIAPPRSDMSSRVPSVGCMVPAARGNRVRLVGVRHGAKGATVTRRWWGLAAAVAWGLLAAIMAWLAVAPTEGCLLSPSLPPQGACTSRLGIVTPLEPGQSAAPFALLVGAAAAGLAWALTLGPAWRRHATVSAVVMLAAGTLFMPAACEWVIPAGRILHPDELVRTCTNLASASTPATSPQDAAVWSITAGLVASMAVWLIEHLARSRRPAAAP